MSEGVKKGQRELLGQCEWCGMPAYERLMLGRGGSRTYKGQKVQKMTKYALVCDSHAEHFEAHGGKVIGG